MPDRDPRVGRLLEARTPPVTVEPRWDDVLRRAGATRRSVVRMPRRRWLVLAAVLAVPVGIAAAQAHHVFVRYFSGGVSGTPRRVIASAIRPFVGHIQADLSRARQLVTVSVGGHRYAYFLAPLTHGNGGCYFEIVDRVQISSDCGYDSKGRYPAVLTPAVGEGSIFGARTLEVSQKPIWVILGDLPAQRKVTSVRVRFQDGTSDRAATNGPYFSYVVSGEHTRAGHRPTALVGLTNAGKVGAIQQLDPSMYSLAATERRGRAFGRMVTVRFFVASVESGLAQATDTGTGSGLHNARQACASVRRDGRRVPTSPRRFRTPGAVRHPHLPWGLRVDRIRLSGARRAVGLPCISHQPGRVPWRPRPRRSDHVAPQGADRRAVPATVATRARPPLRRGPRAPRQGLRRATQAPGQTPCDPPSWLPNRRHTHPMHLPGSALRAVRPLRRAVPLLRVPPHATHRSDTLRRPGMGADRGQPGWLARLRRHHHRRHPRPPRFDRTRAAPRHLGRSARLASRGHLAHGHAQVPPLGGVAIRALAAVHRRIGGADQILRRCAVLRIDGDADAAPEHRLDAVQAVGPLEHVADPVGQCAQ